MLVVHSKQTKDRLYSSSTGHNVTQVTLLPMQQWLVCRKWLTVVADDFLWRKLLKLLDCLDLVSTSEKTMKTISLGVVPGKCTSSVAIYRIEL